jgi:hypothetical protein
MKLSIAVPINRDPGRIRSDSTDKRKKISTIINRDKKRYIYGFGKIYTEWENIYGVGNYIRSGKIYLNQIFEFPRRPYCYLVNIDTRSRSSLLCKVAIQN